MQLGSLNLEFSHIRRPMTFIHGLEIERVKTTPQPRQVDPGRAGYIRERECAGPSSSEDVMEPAARRDAARDARWHSSTAGRRWVMGSQRARFMLRRVDL
uniref:Uncharacterized protein n=1 Tax=Bionectria ochroleuca TaxID=29856 RepID=A0A8H7TPJ6_BIOOC